VDHEPGILALYRDILCLEAEGPSGLHALFADQAQGAASGINPGGGAGESPGQPGFELTACATGAEALAAVRRARKQGTPFALALIDAGLGAGLGADLSAGLGHGPRAGKRARDVDGAAVAEALRASDPAVEIVMVAGHGGPTLSELNRRIPPPEKLLYLHKPFRPQELRQLARSLGGKWRAECGLRELNENLSRLVEARTAELSAAYEHLSRDVAERRRLEERMAQGRKMEALGTLAGGIAHDFNNILGVIMGYAEMIRDGAADGSGLKRRASEIVTAGDRARDLVTQILNFSRQGPQVKTSVKPATLVRETLTLLRSAIPAGVEVRVEGDDPGLSVIGDPTQLRQVVLNLCSNAAQAMRQGGGALTVALSRAEEPGPSPPPELGGAAGYLRLSVSDTGPGMEPEVLGRIFDPFFTTKKPGEGTGLGLSVCHGIVKGHDGAIVVASEPGRGSAFHVFLPLAGDPAAPREAAALAPEVLARPRPARVLLVDDEKPLTDIGREMLEGLGMTVTARTSSVEALEAFRHRSGDFDLVLTDQAMPNMSGLELARELLAIRPDLPVVLCTGFSDSVSAEAARGLGVAEVVMKPLLKAQVAACLARALGDGGGEGPLQGEVGKRKDSVTKWS
jgi:signal transduction histidine kinase/ActR/RegA family two-component response regulator